MSPAGVEALVIGICLIGPPVVYIVRKARRDLAAERWPSTEAAIQSAEVKEVGLRYKTPLPCFAFSYLVDGSYYSGRFALSVAGEQVDTLLKALIGRTMIIQYDPKRPASFRIPDEFIEGYDVRIDI